MHISKIKEAAFLKDPMFQNYTQGLMQEEKNEEEINMKEKRQVEEEGGQENDGRDGQKG